MHNKIKKLRELNTSFRMQKSVYIITEHLLYVKQ